MRPLLRNPYSPQYRAGARLLKGAGLVRPQNFGLLAFGGGGSKKGVYAVNEKDPMSRIFFPLDRILDDMRWTGE